MPGLPAYSSRTAWAYTVAQFPELQEFFWSVWYCVWGSGFFL